MYNTLRFNLVWFYIPRLILSISSHTSQQTNSIDDQMLDPSFPSYLNEPDVELLLKTMLVNIFRNGNLICAGVLYRKNLVITTATYVQSSKYFLSVKNIDSDVHKKVESVFFHDKHNWNRKTHFNLAILLLKEKDNKLTTLRLDKECHTEYSTENLFKFVGWGYEPNSKEEYSEAIQSILLNPMSFEKCSEPQRKPVNKEFEFCAGAYGQTNRASYILHGSPLFTMHDGQITVIGIYSWSELSRFSETEYAPPVFLKVCEFESWIKRKDAELFEVTSSRPTNLLSGWL